MRRRASRPAVYRFSVLAESPAGAPPPTAAATFIAPPTVRGLLALRRAAPDVKPSAWKYEYIGFRSSPLNGVISRLSMNAKSLPRFVLRSAGERLPPAS